MYTRHEFYVALQNEVSEITGKSVELIEAVKENDSVLHGLTVNIGERLHPIIYIDRYYFDDIDDADVSFIAEEISNIFLSEPDERVLTWSSQLSDNLINCIKNSKLRVLNKKRNEHFLEEIVYREFLDLAVFCYVPIDERASVRVTHKLLTHIGISEDELFDIALANTCEDCKFISMNAIMRELLNKKSTGDRDEFDFNGIPDEMFVLTTHSNKYGASLLTCPNILDSIGAKYGSYYVLPSSIHECIILVNEQHDARDLLWMVKQVNSTEVSADEILTDAVYYYDAIRKEISIAAK